MIGRVYKIIVNCSNDIYIGSTIQECRARWQEHKYNYTTWKNEGKMHFKKAYDLFEKYGIENCKIILIKEYEVVDKQHLVAYEQLWINKLKPINSVNAFSLKKLYHKQWYKTQLQKNPNKFKEKIKCECGLIITKNNLPRHRKNQNHKKSRVGLTKL